MPNNRAAESPKRAPCRFEELMGWQLTEDNKKVQRMRRYRRPGRSFPLLLRARVPGAQDQCGCPSHPRLIIGRPKRKYPDLQAGGVANGLTAVRERLNARHLVRFASSLAAALFGERRVMARQGWEGEKSGLSEQPAKDSERVSVRPDSDGSGVFKYFVNTLLGSGDSKRAEFFAEWIV